MPPEGQDLNDTTLGSPVTGNPAASSESAMTVREVELERRRAAFQSRADRLETEKQERDRLIAQLQAENAALRGQPAPAPVNSAVVLPNPAPQPVAAATSRDQELADLRSRVARSERRDTIEDFLGKPDNSDLLPLRHMIPATMDVTELPQWAANMRSLGPAMARGAANNMVRQVVGASGAAAVSAAENGLPVATNALGGYVPPQIAGQSGGPVAIVAGGAGFGAQGSSIPTPDEISGAFKDLKPGDHQGIWDKVTTLMKRVPLPQGTSQHR